MPKIVEKCAEAIEAYGESSRLPSCGHSSVLGHCANWVWVNRIGVDGYLSIVWNFFPHSGFEECPRQRSVSVTACPVPRCDRTRGDT